jgi:hypothetical protein
MATSDYWVQPPISINKKGGWTTEAYFGQSESVDSGAKFEVQAFAGVTSPLAIGKMPDWPKAAASSDLVVVTRK